MLFIPTKGPMSKDSVIRLYYTEGTDKASISVEGKNKNSYALNKKEEVTLRVDIPADGYTLWVWNKSGS